jgi:hypothetical protein
VRRALRALAATALVATAGCGGEDKKDRQASPQLSNEKLAADWWVWATKRPEAESPVNDPTGKRCTQDQPKDVFFLAGTFGGTVKRTCTVPAGRPLFVPAVNQTCPVQGGKVQADCRTAMRDATASVRVDGRKVPTRYVESKPFELKGMGKTVALGHHAVIDPLEPGRHKVRIKGSMPVQDFTVLVRYDLTVK